MEVKASIKCAIDWFKHPFSIAALSILGGALLTIISGIILIYAEHSIVTTNPIKQLRSLENPDSSLNVKLWIDTVGKTQFHQNDRVNIFYEVTGILKGRRVYISLLNISPNSEKINPILQEYEICVGYTYSIPPLTSVDCPLNFIDSDKQKKITFNAKGTEYFKAIVLSEKLGEWEKILQKAANKIEPATYWGTTELEVKVITSE